MNTSEMIEKTKIVYLNVGGCHYTTSLTTLRKQANSLLGKWFAQPDDMLGKNKNGEYFIDRDGEVYRYVLQYLRGPEFVYPEDEYSLNLFLVECQHLQLDLPSDKRWCFIKSNYVENDMKQRFFISNRAICLKTKFTLEMVSDESVIMHIRQNEIANKEDGSLFCFKYSGKILFTFDALQKKIFLKMAGGMETTFFIKVANFFISFENKGDFKLNFQD